MPDTSKHESAGRRDVILMTGGAIAACCVMAFSHIAPNGFRPKSGWLAVGFVVFAVLALPLGVLVGRRVRQRLVPMATMFVLGALVVDGLAIGFQPGLYGQRGDSITGLAALLLWGVGVTVAAARLGDQVATGASH